MTIFKIVTDFRQNRLTFPSPSGIIRVSGWTGANLKNPPAAMKIQDNKHCVRCGEPTSARFCVECERDEYAEYLREIQEGGAW